MSNFLLVEIEENPLYTIRKIMDLLSECYHNLRLNYIQESNGRFIFTGVLQTNFRYSHVTQGVRSAVVLDPPVKEYIFQKQMRRLKKFTDAKKLSMLYSFWNLPVEV